MQILPAPGKGRPLAVVLALITVTLVYLLGLHWFVMGHLELTLAARELRAAEQRFLRTLAQREALNEALERVRRLEQTNQGFLPEENFDVAAAALTSRLRQLIQQHASNPATCQLLTHNPARHREPELYLRVTIKARIVCELEDFWRVLHAIENSSPMLMVDEVLLRRLAIARAAQPIPMGVDPSEASRLDISMDVYGYLRQRGGS